MIQTHLDGNEIYYLYGAIIKVDKTLNLNIHRVVIGHPELYGIIGRFLGINYIALSEELPERSTIYLTDSNNRSIKVIICKLIKELYCPIYPNSTLSGSIGVGEFGDLEKLLPSLRSLLVKIGDYENQLINDFNTKLFK